VPGALIAAGTSVVRAADREVRVVMAMTLPRVVVFAELLSADECGELIALARSRLARSETVETSDRVERRQPGATSDGMFFTPGEFPVCARLEQRIAALLGWPIENGEGLQILRYGPAPSTCRTSTTSIPTRQERRRSSSAAASASARSSAT
jgi:prolyl 4-hydroxylase